MHFFSQKYAIFLKNMQFFSKICNFSQKYAIFSQKICIGKCLKFSYTYKKNAILFLIYLLADKANYFKIQRHEPKNKIKIFVILTFLKGPFFLKTLQSNILLTALIKSLLTNFFLQTASFK